MNEEEFNNFRYRENLDYLRDEFQRKRRVKIVLDLIGRNKKVLDLACSEGFITKKIQENDNVVVGLEISDRAIQICKARNILVIKADVSKKLPFEDNHFDVVFCGEIIEHIFDVDAFLQEIYRVLKKGGFVVITTPNVAMLTNRLRLMLGINPKLDTGLLSSDGKQKSPGHIRYFTFKDLDMILRRNNLKVVEKTTDYIAFNRVKLTFTPGKMIELGCGIIIKAKKF